MQIVLRWYFDIWNLFSLEFVFAGATCECSFCCVSESFVRLFDVILRAEEFFFSRWLHGSMSL